MKSKITRLGAAILGCVAAFMFSTAVASADPPDPHKPDMTKGYCPGGRWGWGELAVCDGEKYPDGSYWHQWTKTYIAGPKWYYDCVGEGQFDPRDPIRIAPVAAYLATADCPMTGQFLAVHGGTVTMLRNWSADAHVQHGHRPWTVADLAPELEALPRPDTMDELMHFFAEAVGPAELRVLVNYANTYFRQSLSE